MEFVAGITQHALGESLRLAHGEAAREQAEAAHRSALASVERTGGRALLPLIRWDQAMLARLLGRRDDEDHRLREALDRAESMGAYGYAARIREQQASRAADGGRRSAAVGEGEGR